jgi:hypothetical protein
VLAAPASILLSRLTESSTVSTHGLPMLNFQLNFLSLGAPSETPDLFDTATLSGLYLFATARTGHRSGFPLHADAGHLTAEGAIEVGRRPSAAFARKQARAGDVSN